MNILCIIGTRPEAIKMAPLINLLKNDSRFECFVCSTSQHKTMLESALSFFGIKPDFDLAIMKPDQNYFDVSVNILTKVEPVITKINPEIILVQGDTTTAFIAALAAFYLKIRIGHIEAGLRTNRKDEPYPEEINRQLISRLADFHFAPTQEARQNLIAENIPSRNIFVTGNTVIDALQIALNTIPRDENEWTTERFPEISEMLWLFLKDKTKKLILVTAHRRENITSGIKNIASAIQQLTKRDDVFVVLPVHPNPEVKNLIHNELKGIENIFLLEPLSYPTFIFLIEKCYFILTDSGGIQEEASALGKPLLVTRNTTDRREVINSGTAKLVGTNIQSILYSAVHLLDDGAVYQKMTIPTTIYGDGNASQKIIGILADQIT